MGRRTGESEIASFRITTSSLAAHLVRSLFVGWRWRWRCRCWICVVGCARHSGINADASMIYGVCNSSNSYGFSEGTGSNHDIRLSDVIGDKPQEVRYRRRLKPVILGLNSEED
ncbi:hypothetical protein GUJ93_ZPchr0012g19325 [Zizania palustris]|uniref:Uncharacterized protein n=1 Tax=Zizania palustris TaxID=103762 RepID=A0A8J6BQY4_ZIZPA|nr:hypothetical protein GUJ93_ZPchr0012g19325 [Zizania palustris]